MNQTVRVEKVDWKSHRETLTAIRHQVFVIGQQVPASLELDEHDLWATHWIAYVGEQAVGTARLRSNGHIGRMAVLEEFRGQGIGGKILSGIIDYCRSVSAQKLYLHAQLQAIPFYQNFGFECYGPEFMDAGIPHQSMQLILRESELGQDAGRIAVKSIAESALELIKQSRRELYLLSNSLEADWFDHSELSEALSALARRSADTDIRLLVLNPKPLIGSRHRLVELHRRLSSKVPLRCYSGDPADFDQNFLIADGRGVLCWDRGDPERAWIDYNNQPVANDLTEQFKRAWQHSAQNPEFRSFSL